MLPLDQLLPVSALALLVLGACGCSSLGGSSAPTPAPEAPYFLEIVTTEVEATCATLSAARGVVFGDPVAALGNAHVAELADGRRISVRAPMHDAEEPTTRTYILVEDLDAALAAAEAAGAQVAMRRTPMPGEGDFAIYFLGGNQFGLWEK